MLKPAIGICPEGWPFIGFAAFTALVTALFGWRWPTAILWLFCLFAMYFFRDPERVITEGPGIAVSPADGKIIDISTRPDPISGESVTRVSIFMNVFNVHVNRSPVACEVISIKYIPGKFINASFDKASEDNERCHWRLQETDGKTFWTMTQIAGLIARRIVCRAEKGDELNRGERLGLIRFGSRVDLYLPDSYAPAVVLGDKVYGGETVIARKK